MAPVDPVSLPLAEKAALLTGADFATTVPSDAAGVPPIVLVDGPHGVRPPDTGADHLGIAASRPATCFPPAVAVGSSWDPAVAARVGAAVAREARAYGIHVVLGPGVNIKRSPLCGRNFEYYSEDPLLAGALAEAHVRGLQGEGVGASVKHFAVNNQETDRMRVSADVDERTLREIYLPAFERVVTRAQPATVMSAYNRINGVPASANTWLLTELLRGEWGFDGVVVSDWGAVTDRVAALAAGLDLAMPGDGGPGAAAIVEAVKSGALGEDVVDRGVRRIAALGAAFAAGPAGADARLGTLDTPDARTGPGSGSGPAAGLDVDAHHALARELAAECVVLLKNDGATLPLEPGVRVAVLGGFATTPRFQGGGSSHINATRTPTALEAVTALAGGGGTVTYAQGFTVEGAAKAEPAGELRAEAVAVAAAADVAIVFAGLPEQDDTEGCDRTTLDLPADQVALIRAVATQAPRTVVVLSNGGVVTMEDWHDDVDAIVEGGLLGQAAGPALADVLFGVVNPSGRLAETIPRRLQDTPSYLNFPGENGHVRYGEGVMVGYRYYTSVDLPVRHPFGHGLTYTTFATTGLTVNPTGPGTATVSLTVTNTGPRAGRHVVQVYVATTAGPVRRPGRELRAFTKVTLEPGESREVTFDLDRRAFAYYDIVQRDWVVAPGGYTIQIGENAVDIVAEASLTLSGDVVVRPLSLDTPVGEWFAHPVAGPELLDLLARGMPPQNPEQAEENARLLRMIDSMPMRQFLGFTGDVLTAEHVTELIARSAP